MDLWPTQALLAGERQPRLNQAPDPRPGPLYTAGPREAAVTPTVCSPSSHCAINISLSEMQENQFHYFIVIFLSNLFH